MEVEQREIRDLRVIGQLRKLPAPLAVPDILYERELRATNGELLLTLSGIGQTCSRRYAPGTEFATALDNLGV